MFGISVSDAAKICNGTLSSSLNSDREIKRIVYDSRSVSDGDLFVAYKGASVDGHNFIKKAFENGALTALAEYVPDGLDNYPIIVVEDVQKALEAITAAFRLCIDCPIIGVTGSVGKTTTKEMIASILSQYCKVHKTDGNHNNLIGVPCSMSGIDQDDDVAVIEMGISIPGEMDRLGAMVRPGIMVYTNIGHTHLEFLKNLDGVFNEKISALKYMHDDSTVIFNGDDEYFKSYNCSQRKILYGKGENCDVRAVNITDDENIHVSFNIIYKDRKIHVKLPVFGHQMVYAALAGAAVGFVLGLSDEDIINGIASFEIVGRRLSVVDTGYITLIDDCYNSNLDSCKASIESFTNIPGHHVAIIGDFLEQGDNSIAQHLEIGKFAKDQNVDLVIGVGQFGEYTSDIHYGKNTELIPDLNKYIKKGDIVLVKGSLGVHLDIVSDELKKLC